MFVDLQKKKNYFKTKTILSPRDFANAITIVYITILYNRCCRASKNSYFFLEELTPQTHETRVIFERSKRSTTVGFPCTTLCATCKRLDFTSCCGKVETRAKQRFPYVVIYVYIHRAAIWRARVPENVAFFRFAVHTLSSRPIRTVYI